MSHYFFMIFTKDIILIFFFFSIVLLFRMNVSYVCISHTEGSCFNVYRSKGRPSQESMELMTIPERMEEHIKSLRSEMIYKHDTEIVLILSLLQMR